VLKASGFIAADIASHGILLAFCVLPSRCSVACHATMGVSQRFVGQNLVVWISDSQVVRHQPVIASERILTVMLQYRTLKSINVVRDTLEKKCPQ